MGRKYTEIDTALEAFIRAQRMFFVATAPLAASGHVNVSPKGLDTLRVLSPHRLAYLDYVGSGAETIAHLTENGRIALMWCAFEGPPRILRIQGDGEVLDPGHVEFNTLRPLFPDSPTPRAIIVITVRRIADSCGFGVPLLQFQGNRSQLAAWATRKGPDGLARYQQEKNGTSIDGLPAVNWIES